MPTLSFMLLALLTLSFMLLQLSCAGLKDTRACCAAFFLRFFTGCGGTFVAVCPAHAVVWTTSNNTIFMDGKPVVLHGERTCCVR